MKKTLITILATVLICCCVVGGTLAWLMDISDTVTNTFTMGNITIDLEETVSNSFNMVPGVTLAKDPTITIGEKSEACWLFIKIVETNNVMSTAGDGTITRYVQYTVDEAQGWELLETTNTDGVVTSIYYQKLDATTADVTKTVLTGGAVGANGQVEINSNITKDMVTDLTANKPTLAFTAYAIQQEGFANQNAAWAEAQNAAN